MLAASPHSYRVICDHMVPTWDAHGEQLKAPLVISASTFSAITTEGGRISVIAISHPGASDRSNAIAAIAAMGCECLSSFYHYIQSARPS